MTRNEMKRKLAEMVIKARTVEALELVQKKMEMLGFTDLVFEDTEEEAVVDTAPWKKDGVSRGTYYRNKKKERETETSVETSVETGCETDPETGCETPVETNSETAPKPEVPQRVINKVETPKEEPKLGSNSGVIKGQFWLNPDGGELTWDDITHRMIFETEDDAKSACAQVGKNYLDYVWIQNPETKQFFTGGELATDTHLSQSTLLNRK